MTILATFTAFILLMPGSGCKKDEDPSSNASQNVYV